MSPVYIFHRDLGTNTWLVSRIVNQCPEPLFRCASAPEARALAQALRAAATGDAAAKCDAFRSLGLRPSRSATLASVH